MPPESQDLAQGSAWKKVLWWVLGVVSLLGVVLLVSCILRRKGPITAAAEIVSETRQRIAAVDITAEAEIAKAAGASEQVVAGILHAAEIKDERQRLDYLATMLRR